MLDGIKELSLQVSYLIPFIWFRCKGCFKGFSVIKYTYVACLKVALWFVSALSDFFYGLLDNDVSKIELFVKIAASKEVASLLRRLKEFWIRLRWMWSKLFDQVFLDVAVYFMFEIACISCFSLQLDFHL